MATVKFNSNEQINNKQQSQGNDAGQETKVHETDQRVNTAPRDRSHTTAVMDTDKS
jgi:hypothetical protein